jgi:hypothetical protein
MKQNEETSTPFVWILGQGINAEASLRLQHRHSRPSQPMGEAWFMGDERRMFTHLLECEATELSVSEVYDCFFEMLGGVRSFGTLDFLPRREWESWFPYFLAQFTSPQHIAQKHGWTSTLISGVMTFYPDADKLREHNPQFCSDVLSTLGRVLMESCFWTNGEINVRHELHQIKSPRFLSWGYYEVSDLFSASMFLCWKYLRAEQIETWFGSVLDIESVHWRAQLLMWLLGAQAFFNGEVTQPCELEGRKPDISWAESEYLNGFYEGHPRRDEPDEFLKAENIGALRSAVEKLVTPELFFSWLDSFAKSNSLQSKLLEMPDQFFETFFK